MHFQLQQTHLVLRNSTVRIPFRYGNACLTRCPQAILQVVIRADGQQYEGYAGDCLPPGWFDKTPDRDFSRQIDDMRLAIRLAETVFLEEAGSEVQFFEAWLSGYHRVQKLAVERRLSPLLASFGISMVERALLDAIARAANVSFAVAVRKNLYGIRGEVIHNELTGLEPCDWLPEKPAETLYCRHTLGIGDPLTDDEIASEDKVADGSPQSLEAYITRLGIRYFKVKVCNDLPHDIRRLTQLAKLAESHWGDDYQLTLDGNEQYKSAEQFDELVTAIEAHSELSTLWKNTLAIEQPLDRSIALSKRHTTGIRQLGKRKCVIIDESDVSLDSYPQALQLGYRGVSSKNCKGPIKSLLNAGLTWVKNERGKKTDFLMTGEDLCSVGIVPVQADLCLAATLGLTHIERNGHHYHPGLSYLPVAQQEAALAAHGDFYAKNGDLIGPTIRHGRLDIASLQCTGFGFAVLPDVDAMEPAEEWRFESLGL